MTLQTERDPRETIRLILDDEQADSDYQHAGAKPARIEAVERSPMRLKLEQADDALYIWRPADGQLSQHGAEWDYIERRPVQIEAWVPTSRGADHAHALYRDVLSIVLSYATDNKSATAWNGITPDTESDTRHEATPERADYYVASLLVNCVANRAP